MAERIGTIEKIKELYDLVKIHPFRIFGESPSKQGYYDTVYELNREMNNYIYYSGEIQKESKVRQLWSRAQHDLCHMFIYTNWDILGKRKYNRWNEAIIAVEAMVAFAHALIEGREPECLYTVATGDEPIGYPDNSIILWKWVWDEELEEVRADLSFKEYCILLKHYENLLERRGHIDYSREYAEEGIKKTLELMERLNK